MTQTDTFPVVVKTFYGLEDTLVSELEAIGAEGIEKANRAVHFHGSLRKVYEANLKLRTAIKVLVPLHKFQAKSEKALYKGVYEYPWHEHFSYRETFAIDGVVHSDHFRHSQYAALKTKDAIADKFRDKSGKRPSVDVEAPDFRITLHIRHDQVQLLADSSGDALFKRGYRSQQGAAPVNEALAAGQLLIAGWQGQSHFVDFMCGSGTYLAEAALIAHNIPPNYFRNHFGFQQWRNYDARLWREIKNEARKERTAFDFQLWGSDINPQAVKIAQKNLSGFYFRDEIKLEKRDFRAVGPPAAPGLLMTNPPYGQRLQAADIKQLYRDIGDALKNNFAGYDAWIFSSNMQAIKDIGLRSKKRVTLFNGPLEGRLLYFPMQEGKFDKPGKKIPQ